MKTNTWLLLAVISEFLFWPKMASREKLIKLELRALIKPIITQSHCIFQSLLSRPKEKFKCLGFDKLCLGKRGNFGHFPSVLRKFKSFFVIFAQISVNCCQFLLFSGEQNFLANKRCLEACIQHFLKPGVWDLFVIFCENINRLVGKRQEHIILLHIATQRLIIFIIEFLMKLKREICMLVKIGVTHNKT